MRLFKLIFLLLRLSLMATAIHHHWVLENEIIPKPETPFLMREPDNLPAFLSQIQNVKDVEKSFIELLRHREKIIEHIESSVQHGKDTVDQAKCAMEYFNLEKQSSYLTLTPSYAKRIDLPNDKQLPMNGNEEPFCEQFTANVEGCFSNEQMASIANMRIAPEKSVFIGEIQLSTDLLRRIAMELLNTEPKLWKSYLLGSYYWRHIGNFSESIKCACRAVTFAPNDVKDIALLSFGITLFRAGCLDDADVILTGATKLEPDIAENHFALATALAIKHDFNRSLAHFERAERLDKSLLPKSLPIRNFISCFQNLSKKTSQMHTFLEFIKNEVREFKTLKQQIKQKHETIMHLQVPLGTRTFQFANHEELQKRGQYCSMRKLTRNQEEPVLFCDFYSEMQMRLESKDLDISRLERELKTTSELIMKQVSIELGQIINFYENTGEKKDSTQRQKILAVNRNKQKRGL